MESEHNGHERKGMFQKFFHSAVTGSIVLLACATAALVWANSRWAEKYFALEHTRIAVTLNGAALEDLTLGHWIGDGLMVIFFFVVGLEIKREIIVGRLSSPKRAILPVSAAIGGMIVPAIIYICFNFAGEGQRGWGIPMATDIAFALGILFLFGRRAPIGLKVFLAALAIADDLGAVLVIAIFYTEQLNFEALAVAGALLFFIFMAGRANIRQNWIYVLLSVGVWAAVHASGIHATVAGVLIAMTVPVRAVIDPDHFLETGKRRIAQLEKAGLTQESMLHDQAQIEALNDLYFTSEDMRPPGLSLEHELHPVTAFLILPLFAFFKAGVPIEDTMHVASDTIALGVICGLVLGKPIGVMLFSWLAIRTGWADLPKGVTWLQLLGVSCLAGVGFTMSIFVSELAFKSEALVDRAKVGVLLASVLAGIIGYLILRKALANPSQS